MEQTIENLTPFIKRVCPLILGGAIGAIVHRLRTKMSFWQFLASIVISMFVALSVGLISQEYFELADTITFVLCGVSGVFSKALLDEIEEIIKSASRIIESRYGRPNSIEIIPSVEIENDTER